MKGSICVYCLIGRVSLAMKSKDNCLGIISAQTELRIVGKDNVIAINVFNLTDRNHTALVTFHKFIGWEKRQLTLQGAVFPISVRCRVYCDRMLLDFKVKDFCQLDFRYGIF